MSSKDNDTPLSRSFCFEFHVCLHYCFSALVIPRGALGGAHRNTMSKCVRTFAKPIRSFCLYVSHGRIALLAVGATVRYKTRRTCSERQQSLDRPQETRSVHPVHHAEVDGFRRGTHSSRPGHPTVEVRTQCCHQSLEKSSKMLQTLLCFVTFVNFMFSVSISCSFA
jgi:hypothetical protein